MCVKRKRAESLLLYRLLRRASVDVAPTFAEKRMNVTDKILLPICLRKRILCKWRSTVFDAGGLETQLKNFGRFFSSRDAAGASCGDGIQVDAARSRRRPVTFLRKESLRVKFVPLPGGAATGYVQRVCSVRPRGAYGCSPGICGQPPPLFRLLAESLRTIVGDDADEPADGRKYRRRRAPLRGNPEGLVSFHRYGDEVRKSRRRASGRRGAVRRRRGRGRFTFTVSPEHLTRFEALLAEKIPGYESCFGVRKYRISFLRAGPFDRHAGRGPDCTPFRRADGRLLFRLVRGADRERLGKIVRT